MPDKSEMPDSELDPMIRRNKFLAQKRMSSSVKIMPSAPLAKDPRPPRPRSRGVSERSG